MKKVDFSKPEHETIFLRTLRFVQYKTDSLFNRRINNINDFKLIT